MKPSGLPGHSPLAQDVLLPYFFSAISLLQDLVIDDKCLGLVATPILKDQLRYLSTSANAVKGSIPDDALAFLQRFTDLTASMGPTFDVNKLHAGEDSARAQSDIAWVDDVMAKVRSIPVPSEILRQETHGGDSLKSLPPSLPTDQNFLSTLLEGLNERSRKTIEREPESRWEAEEYYSSLSDAAISPDESEDQDEGGTEEDSSDYEPDIVMSTTPASPPTARSWNTLLISWQVIEGSQVVDSSILSQREPSSPRRLGRWESTVVWDLNGNKYLVRPRP